METSTDYRRFISINADQNVVFNALSKNISKWWGTIEGLTENVNDEFTVSFGPESYWKFKVLEMKRPEGIVWKCTESHQDHKLEGIDAEWTNTEMHWTLSGDEGKVRVELLHKGLLKTCVCYDVCSKAWDFYLTDSLKPFLETGAGQPGGK
jgi:uncharacterized protein YndB with AHSA1/START domain